MYTITTPIPYVNGEPHLGHLLEHIHNDVIARFRRRIESQPALFTIGADQHGLKIMEKALELNIPTKQFVDRQAEVFETLWKKYEISYDEFVPTSSENHRILSQIIFNNLYSKGFIYQKEYEGNYCVGCEDFYAPSQLNEDECCPIHLTKPIITKEKNYFFSLSKFQSQVGEFLTTARIVPESNRGEWLNFIVEGLQDISISREQSRLPWGIPIEIDGTATDQVMYVWFEALLNYLTAMVNPETFDRYRELVVERKAIELEIMDEIKSSLPIDFWFGGKDIAKFHLVIFPAILSALDLPWTINSRIHGFINDANGHKFSKSLNNAVYPLELEEKFGVEGSRYVMLAEVSTSSDTNWDWNRVVDSHNAQLGNNLGNVVMRVSTLIEKYFDGIIDLDQDFEVLAKVEDELEQKVEGIVEGRVEAEVQNNLQNNLKLNFEPVYSLLHEFETQKAIQTLFQEVTKINLFLETTKPWSLAKDMETNGVEIKRILTLCAKAIVDTGAVLSIFLPDTGAKLVEIFTQPKITKAEVMFPKVELEK